MRKALRPRFHLPPNADVDSSLRRIAHGEFVVEESEASGEESEKDAETPAEREDESSSESSTEEDDEDGIEGRGNQRRTPPPSLPPQSPEVQVVQPPKNVEKRNARKTSSSGNKKSKNKTPVPAARPDAGAMGDILRAIQGLASKVEEIDRRTQVTSAPADPNPSERIDWFSQLPERMGDGDELRGIRPPRNARASRRNPGLGTMTNRARPTVVLDRRRSRRGRRGRRDRDNSSDSSEDADSEFGVMDNEEFWELFKETPFKNPVLRVDELVGENMLRLALTNHPSVSSYVESIHWTSKSRNKHEAAKLARMIDFNIGELGIDCVRKMGSTEIAMRRLSALQVADKQGSWTLATHVDETVTGLLTARQQRHMLASARLEQRLGSLGGGPATNDESSKGAGKKKAPGAE